MVAHHAHVADIGMTCVSKNPTTNVVVDGFSCRDYYMHAIFDPCFFGGFGTDLDSFKSKPAHEIRLIM